MTNEEAIETLKTNYPDACYEDLRKAVDMAIDALQGSQRSYIKGRIEGRVEMRTYILEQLKTIVGSEAWNNI